MIMNKCVPSVVNYSWSGGITLHRKSCGNIWGGAKHIDENGLK